MNQAGGKLLRGLRQGVTRNQNPSSSFGSSSSSSTIMVQVARASYHSGMTPDMLYPGISSEATSTDFDAAAQWGYRVVHPNAMNASTPGGRPMSTITSTAIEDYDSYTLHCSPSETPHCDLGTTVMGSTNGEESILEFDSAGMVKPIWETVMDEQKAQEKESSDSNNSGWNIHESQAHLISEDDDSIERFEHIEQDDQEQVSDNDDV